MPGDQGERGPHGDHGQHGDQGFTGEQGKQGITGAEGRPGTPGTPGAAGAVGEPGKTGAAGEPGKRGEKGEPEPIHPWRWRALTIWIIGFTAAVFYLWLGLQDSRLQSCRQTYEGMRKAFIPLAPPPEKRTKAVQDNIDKFNTTIDTLKSQCKTQINNK